MTNRFPTIPAGAIAVITHTRPTNPTPIEIHDGDPTPTTPDPVICECPARRQLRGGAWGWDTLTGAWYGDDTDHVTEVRLCAVIDPASSVDRDRLLESFAAVGYPDVTDTDLALALEAYATPPVPNPGEPENAGPHLDRHGLRWFRRSPGEWITIDDLTIAPSTWDVLWDTRGPITINGGVA